MGFVGNAIQGVGSSIVAPIMGGAGSLVGSAVNPLTNAITQKNNFQAVLPEDVVNQQKDLAAMLLAQAQGKGPSVAQQQYKNNLNQVAAQQAGAIASQKGISPALQARMIANQAAAAQMQGAGQAAALRASEQLGAQSQLANQQSQLVGQSLQAQGINAGISKENTAAQNQMTLGALQGASAAMGKPSADKKFDGGYITLADALRQGGKVPGKPKFPGDNAGNDTVHAMLSPGEIVIPRSLAEDPERAKKFIEELNKKTGKSGYRKVLEAKKRAKSA